MYTSLLSACNNILFKFQIEPGYYDDGSKILPIYNVILSMNMIFFGTYRASNIVLTCELLIWIIGILSNLVSVIIFRHENMGKNSINLIFWWLSISDLLELVILALYQWHRRWSGQIELIIYSEFQRNIYDIIFVLIEMYLFQVIHTITIALNIILVFHQYKVVAHPLMNVTNPFSKRSIQLGVICIYILSFVLYLPFWYIHDIEQNSTMLMKKLSWTIGIRKRRQSVPLRPDEDYYLTSITSSSSDIFVNICILFCGVVLRIGPLIILVIFCAMLLFAIQNSHRKRQNVGMSASNLSKAQKKVNRMNLTIVVIIIMFLISEIPLATSGFSRLSPNSTTACSSALNSCIQFFFILLNCSYNMFCYLIRTKQYRKTLKLLLSKCNYWFSSRARVSEQTVI